MLDKRDLRRPSRRLHSRQGKAGFCPQGTRTAVREALGADDDLATYVDHVQVQEDTINETGHWVRRLYGMDLFQQ